MTDHTIHTRQESDSISKTVKDFMRDVNIEKQYRRKLRIAEGSETANTIDFKEKNDTVPSSYEARVFSAQMTSEAEKSSFNRKRFIHTLDNFMKASTYEDNLEEGTEVFADHLEDQQVSLLIAKQHREIDLVLQSRVDKATKQRMIEEITERFRRLRSLHSRPQSRQLVLAHGDKYQTSYQGMFSPRRQSEFTVGNKIATTRNYDLPKRISRQEKTTAAKSRVDEANDDYLLPEVTALAGKKFSKRMLKDYSEHLGLGSSRSGIKTSKRSIGSSGSPKFLNVPKLHSKRTSSNIYCVNCCAGKEHEVHDHDRASSSVLKKPKFRKIVKETGFSKKRLSPVGVFQPPRSKALVTPGRIRAQSKQPNQVETTMQPKMFTERQGSRKKSVVDHLIQTERQSNTSNYLAKKKIKKQKSSNSPPRKEKEEKSSEDGNMPWEEYLEKQTRKFKKLYGKKLIVEDYYRKTQGGSPFGRRKTITDETKSQSILRNNSPLNKQSNQQSTQQSQSRKFIAIRNGSQTSVNKLSKDHLKKSAYSTDMANFIGGQRGSNKDIYPQGQDQVIPQTAVGFVKKNSLKVSSQSSVIQRTHVSPQSQGDKTAVNYFSRIHSDERSPERKGSRENLSVSENSAGFGANEISMRNLTDLQRPDDSNFVGSRIQSAERTEILNVRKSYGVHYEDSETPPKKHLNSTQIEDYLMQQTDAILPPKIKQEGRSKSYFVSADKTNNLRSLENAISNNSLGKISKARDRSKKTSQERTSPRTKSTSKDVQQGKTSPARKQTTDLMKHLTNNKVKITEHTAVLINGRELLTHKGIQGKIHATGIGFGTGRHSEARRKMLSDVLIQKVEKMPEKNTAEVGTQRELDVKSACASPRTADNRSIALSPRKGTEKSYRDQDDQVTDGRFEPDRFDANVETDRSLLDLYFYKLKYNVEVCTDDIDIIEESAKMVSHVTQTREMIMEVLCPESLPISLPPEPFSIDNCLQEGEDQLLESETAPQSEQVYLLVLPNVQEPDDDALPTDWKNSNLYVLINKMRTAMLSKFQKALALKGLGNLLPKLPSMGKTAELSQVEGVDNRRQEGQGRTAEHPVDIPTLKESQEKVLNRKRGRKPKVPRQGGYKVKHEPGSLEEQPNQITNNRQPTQVMPSGQEESKVESQGQAEEKDQNQSVRGFQETLQEGHSLAFAYGTGKHNPTSETVKHTTAQNDASHPQSDEQNRSDQTEESDSQQSDESGDDQTDEQEEPNNKTPEKNDAQPQQPNPTGTGGKVNQQEQKENLGNEPSIQMLEESTLKQLNADEKGILSYLDCDYFQALLKKKKMKDELHTLNELYEKAKSTIFKLTADMIEPEVSLKMFFTHYKDITRGNVIKLLLRCKRLYDARNQMVGILASLVQVENMTEADSVLQRVLQGQGEKKMNHVEMIRRHLRFLSGTLNKIAVFQTENKLFRGEFKFNDQDQVVRIVRLGEILSGYLITKSELSPALLPNGLLLDFHNEIRTQMAAYREWLDKHTDPVQPPTDQQVERALKEEPAAKDFNTSRVANVLKQMPAIQHDAKPKKVEIQTQELPSHLTSHKVLDEGKTLISDQLIERQQIAMKKREKLAGGDDKHMNTLNEQNNTIKTKQGETRQKPVKADHAVIVQLQSGEWQANNSDEEPLVRFDRNSSSGSGLVVIQLRSQEMPLKPDKAIKILVEENFYPEDTRNLVSSVEADTAERKDGLLQKIRVSQPVSITTHLVSNRYQNPTLESSRSVLSEFTYMKRMPTKIKYESKEHNDEETDGYEGQVLLAQDNSSVRLSVPSKK